MPSHQLSPEAWALLAVMAALGLTWLALLAALIRQLLFPPAAPPADAPELSPELAAILEILMDPTQTATDFSGRLKTAAGALDSYVSAAVAKAVQGSADQQTADMAAINDGVTAVEDAVNRIKALSTPADAQQ